MGVNVVIEGLEDILEKDKNKHKDILERLKMEFDAYNEALAYQISKRKYYKSLIKGDNKYDKDSLRISMDMIGIDVRQISDKIKLTKEAIDHNTLVVDTLSNQLINQYKGLKELSEQRKKELDAINDKLG